VKKILKVLRVPMESVDVKDVCFAEVVGPSIPRTEVAGP